MHGKIIGTLVRKDLALYFRNRFFALTTIALLVVYIAVYFLMPATTSTRFVVGITPADVPSPIREAFESREVEVVPFEDEAAMRTAVEAGDYRVGIVLAPGTAERLEAGERTTITAYYPPGIPAELNRAFNDFLTIVFNEVGYVVTGQALNITRHEETLGYDLAGEELAPRDRLLPLFAVLLFMMETLGLANLIAEEIGRGTLRALLVTPMNIRHLFAGKRRC
jgi:ABC-2 type transport system permease protein